ncbi:protein FAM227B-like isoform X2 [Symsagittifera roscoffensis]|uniref:protein FAM227B-like isoform X2 n=1 Tax=Symsagittifera roscoffensis TaxID=84072 RepID=UPI00307BC6AF
MSDKEGSKFPKNIEEFLLQQNLDEWPQKLSAEGSLLVSVDSVLGSKEDIRDTLKSAAPLRLEVLDELEDRLLKLESELVQYSSMTLTDIVRPSKIKDGIFNVPKKAEIMEQTGNGIEAFREELQKKQRRKKAGVNGDASSKSVEATHFPGFFPKEMLDFPGQYEAPVLMNAVTNRQSFNPGFMKFWKRIFQSEASVAIMQDTFWWIFLDKFEGKYTKQRSARDGGSGEGDGESGSSVASGMMGEREVQVAKDRLFNRIADSFVAMLFSIHPDMKDKFLNVYPDVLAQAICASYVECFPMSKILFNDNFKHYVATICFQWISGIKPGPMHLRDWNVDKLMASADISNPILDAARSGDTSSASGKNTPRKISRHAATQEEKNFDHWNQLSTNTTGRTRKVSQLKSSEKQKKKSGSMPVCGSDQMERLPFSVYGRSPLVAHWLHSKSLAGKSQHTTGPNTMIRVQVEKLNEETVTFQDVIDEVKDNAAIRRREVARIEKETKREIRRIDENLKVQLRSLKNLEQKLAKDPLPSYRSKKDSSISIDRSKLEMSSDNQYIN